MASERNFKGKNNLNYKHGKYCTKYFCSDCGKEVSRFTCKRCQSCAVKYLYKIGKLNTLKENNGMYNKKLTKETRKKMSLAGGGTGIPYEKISKKHKCIDCNKLISYRATRCHSCSVTKQHKDKVFNYHRKINKPESLLNNLLNICLDREYKFIGDGKVIIDGFNPDFINTNGQKKIIELYGDYWHNRKEVKERDKRRIKSYKKYGYKTLIFWEYELKEPEHVIAKVIEFNTRRI